MVQIFHRSPMSSDARFKNFWKFQTPQVFFVFDFHVKIFEQKSAWQKLVFW